MSLNICCSCASQLVTKNPPDRVIMQNTGCDLQSQNTSEFSKTGQAQKAPV